MAPHRYWMVGGTGFPGYFQCYKLRMFDTYDIDAEDVCTGGTPIATTTYGGSPASNAFDNNASSTWCSNGSGEQGIGYDFGAGNEKSIVSFSVKTDTYVPDTFYLNWSDDGVNYTRQSTNVNDHLWTKDAERGFLSLGDDTGLVGHRYWRWKATAGPVTNSTNSFCELSLHDGSGNRINGVEYRSDITVTKIYQNAYPPARLIDGLTNIEFRGGDVYPDSIMFKLGQKAVVREIRVATAVNYDTYNPTSVDIEYSDDGITWATAVSYSGIIWTYAAETKTFAVPLTGDPPEPVVSKRRQLIIT